MAKVMTQLDLLTKHVVGALPKEVNVVAFESVKTYDNEETESLREEIRFLSNQMGGSHPTYQRQGENQGQKESDRDWKDGDCDRDWPDKDHNRERDCRDKDRGP